ncbi:uncharacterized protein LOC143431499 [Xylocopa sonorina]|uniref:uncharacterized protein LOC143431499 n=1 Tax=Xylocopa sonorina TaxID=1818115 RepID=UPI00403A8213
MAARLVASSLWKQSWNYNDNEIRTIIKNAFLLQNYVPSDGFVKIIERISPIKRSKSIMFSHSYRMMHPKGLYYSSNYMSTSDKNVREETIIFMQRRLAVGLLLLFKQEPQSPEAVIMDCLINAKEEAAEMADLRYLLTN